MATTNHLDDAKKALTAQGIDWTKILTVLTAINVTAPQFIALVQSFINAVNAHPAMKAIPAGCCPDDLKAHFESIKCLAECGAKCCDGVTPGTP